VAEISRAFDRDWKEAAEFRELRLHCAGGRVGLSGQRLEAEGTPSRGWKGLKREAGGGTKRRFVGQPCPAKLCQLVEQFDCKRDERSIVGGLGKARQTRLALSGKPVFADSRMQQPVLGCLPCLRPIYEKEPHTHLLGEIGDRGRELARDGPAGQSERE